MKLYLLTPGKLELGRAFEVPVRNLKDLDEPLRRAGQRLREAAKEAFAKGASRSGGAWPGLAAGTKERLQQTTLGSVSITGKARKKYVEAARRGLASQSRAGRATYLAREELQRLAAGGDTKLSLEADLPELLRSKAVARFRKELEKTDEQRRKRKRAITKHKLLGKLASGIKVALKKGGVVVEHVVSWAGIHNEGGSAGGAQIPARPFLELLESDLQALAEDILNHVLDGGEAQ